jgi:ribosome biogenesis protein NSA2
LFIRRKAESRQVKKIAKQAHKLHGMKAKIFNQTRYKDKVNIRKAIKAHEEKKTNVKTNKTDKKEAVPAYLMDRETTNTNKILSNMVKQKRKEKAGKWEVPIAKVKSMSEAEMFSIIKSGKRGKKAWKRIINKPTFVPETFTRKPPKYERFIRPTSLRFKKVNVTHPELKTTFYLDIVGVKRNPQSALYTNLGVLTKGTVLEVNVSDLGLVTQTGKVVLSKYAQITNNPENDGVINALLLV